MPQTKEVLNQKMDEATRRFMRHYSRMRRAFLAMDREQRRLARWLREWRKLEAAPAK
jgi:hypothetical protein